jgi:hypothetical protein
VLHHHVTCTQTHRREKDTNQTYNSQKKSKIEQQKECKQIVTLAKWYIGKRQTNFYQNNREFLLFLLSTHHSRIGLTSLLLNSLDRSLVSVHTLELVDICIQLGVISCIDHLQSLLTSLQRERHQNVNSSEVLAAEEASTIGCSSELRLQKVEVSLEVWLEVHGLESGDDTAGDGTNEKGDLVALENCRSSVSK